MSFIAYIIFKGGCYTSSFKNKLGTAQIDVHWAFLKENNDGFRLKYN